MVKEHLYLKWAKTHKMLLKMNAPSNPRRLHIAETDCHICYSVVKRSESLTGSKTSKLYCEITVYLYVFSAFLFFCSVSCKKKTYGRALI